MSEKLHRDVGRHEAQIDGLSRDMVEVKHCVREIRDTLIEARGGWRALMLVAGCAGTLGAVITYILSAFGWTPRP